MKMTITRTAGTATRSAVTLIDTLAATLTVLALGAMLIPALGAVDDNVEVEASKNNLRQLGMIHAIYAADWDGRQWTVTPDDLTLITHGVYHADYRNNDEVPPVGLGFDCGGEYSDTSRGWAIQPMWYDGNCALGNFRAWNTVPFHQYANGKVYDRMFWAPRDPMAELNPDIRDYWDLDCEWPGSGTPFIFPTYCMSIAAQVDPDVYRAPSRGGAQRALDLDFGHRTPDLASAKYPDLKTQMLEHWWLNPLPDPIVDPNTGFPWFYNQSDRAMPAALFFDGSVRLLPNMEVLRSNDTVVRGGGDPLWNRDIGCFGSGGYFESYALPPSNLETRGLVDQVSSHHVFTTDGILGRDTIFSGGE